MKDIERVNFPDYVHENLKKASPRFTKKSDPRYKLYDKVYQHIREIANKKERKIVEVFCEDCKWSDDSSIIGYQDYYCKHPDNIEIKNTPFRKRTVVYSCDDCNEYNNCDKFEPSLWYKLKNIFK